MTGSMITMRVLGTIFFVLGLAFFGLAFSRPGESQGVFIFLGFQFVIMGIIFVWIAIAMQRGIAHAADLARNGATATATIVDVQDTGVTINNNPRLRLTLNVQPSSGDAFQITANKTVARFAPPRVGDIYTIRYNLINPTDFVFTTEGATDAEGGTGASSMTINRQTVTINRQDLLQELSTAAKEASVAKADPVARLTELTALRDKGVLTPEQFETLKAKILADSQAE